jgi:hypothetical protein
VASTTPALVKGALPPIPASAASLLSALGAENSIQAAALSMFGADSRSLGAHMMAHSSKLKGYLEAIKPSSDALVRYSALQELNELLVMSNEDTLSGYFQVDAFTKELIGVLGGKRTGGDDDDEEHEDDHDEDDEDSALAAALAMSGGSNFVGDENPEAQVLASRCLYNMMEALPGTAHTVVFHNAIPALCSKLLEIQFIDLAGQNISVSRATLDSFIFIKFVLVILDSKLWTKFPRNVRALLPAKADFQCCSTSSTFSTLPSSAQRCMRQLIAVAMRHRMCCRLFKASSPILISASSSPQRFA